VGQTAQGMSDPRLSGSFSALIQKVTLVTFGSSDFKRLSVKN
jgi:hypothetical protein